MTFSVRGFAVALDREPHVRALGALDPRGRDVAADARERLAVGGDEHVAGPIPAAAAGEPSKTRMTRRPLGSGATLTPTPVKRLFCSSLKRWYSAGVK